jgi:TrmH family RNA methyltransferase
MGAHFRLPLRACPWDEIRSLVQSAGLTVYLAAAGDGLPFTQADFRQPLALVVGGEAEGAGSEAQALAHQRIRIPMPGGIESLNAAAAAAILLFEVVRQRQTGPAKLLQINDEKTN